MTDEEARVFDNINAERIAERDRAARLRAALQPFADALTEGRWTWLYADTRCDDADVALLKYDDTGVTLGMLRRARAALDAEDAAQRAAAAEHINAIIAAPQPISPAELEELRRQGEG